MNKFKKYFSAQIFVLIASLFFSSAVFAGPVDLLQSIANNLISQLKANQASLKTKPGLVYSLAYRYVVPYADIDTMAMRVLPPSVWRGASPAQRATFKKHFTNLLVRTYASALSDYKDQTVKFFPVRGGGSNVTVNSQIERTDGPGISVSYRMINRGGRWKIYDMSVEGVSMLESFRSQFSDLLQTGNLDEVNRRLAQHNRGR